eukprot:scaffold5370_cov249-Pinguiococcus_pyrenoidosus.AAC.3
MLPGESSGLLRSRSSKHASPFSRLRHTPRTEKLPMDASRAVTSRPTFPVQPTTVTTSPCWSCVALSAAFSALTARHAVRRSRAALTIRWDRRPRQLYSSCARHRAMKKPLLEAMARKSRQNHPRILPKRARKPFERSFPRCSSRPTRHEARHSLLQDR